MLDLIRRHSLIIRYVFAGGTGALVNLAVLYIATDIFGVWYLASTVLSFTIAFLVSFLLQKFWAFRDKRQEGMHGQVFFYLFTGIFNMIVNTLLMYTLVDKLHIHYMISQVIVGGTIALWSFFIYRYVIFKTEVTAEVHTTNA
ncbi:MAG TPA: GtrA family protein [Candidatus Paceibacterota bacterium]